MPKKDKPVTTRFSYKTAKVIRRVLADAYGHHVRDANEILVAIQAFDRELVKDPTLIKYSA